MHNVATTSRALFTLPPPPCIPPTPRSCLPCPPRNTPLPILPRHTPALQSAYCRPFQKFGLGGFGSASSPTAASPERTGTTSKRHEVIPAPITKSEPSPSLSIILLRSRSGWGRSEIKYLRWRLRTLFRIFIRICELALPRFAIALCFAIGLISHCGYPESQRSHKAQKPHRRDVISLTIIRGTHGDIFLAACSTGYTRQSISLNAKLRVCGPRKAFKV